jgi:hypothetical protein
MAWQIRELTRSEGTWYRLHVSGLNTEAVPEQEFSWAVPSIADDRFILAPDADDKTRTAFEQERAAQAVAGA